MPIARSVLDLIGKTPIVSIRSLAGEVFSGRTELVCKLEYFNPSGSIKDRLALAMVEDAEKQGVLQPGCTPPNIIVEPTSGNTGIGLAMVAAVKGYKLILTMPDNMSHERQALLRAFGAELVLTPAVLGMNGAVDAAYEIVEKHSGAVVLQQFFNPAGPAMHRRTTAAEIWKDCGGTLDMVVVGIGTGGTISGVGQCLKSLDNNIQIIGVEPAESPVISGGKKGAHLIQGIGAGFVPEILDRSVMDKIISVASQDAIKMSQALMREHGIMGGISTGAMAHVALELAKKPENKGKRILFFAADTAERYISTALFPAGS